TVLLEPRHDPEAAIGGGAQDRLEQVGMIELTRSDRNQNVAGSRWRRAAQAIGESLDRVIRPGAGEGAGQRHADPSGSGSRILRRRRSRSEARDRQRSEDEEADEEVRY